MATTNPASPTDDSPRLTRSVMSPITSAVLGGLLVASVLANLSMLRIGRYEPDVTGPMSEWFASIGTWMALITGVYALVQTHRNFRNEQKEAERGQALAHERFERQQAEARERFEIEQGKAQDRLQFDLQERRTLEEERRGAELAIEVMMRAMDFTVNALAKDQGRQSAMVNLHAARSLARLVDDSDVNAILERSQPARPDEIMEALGAALARGAKLKAKYLPEVWKAPSNTFFQNG